MISSAELHKRLKKAVRDMRKAQARVDTLLEMCKSPECPKCGKAFCEESDPLHFHHDGCPSCGAPTSDDAL